MLIEEFEHNGKLNDYVEIVSDLISLIRKNGFAISIRYDSIQSKIDWTAKRIWISFKKEHLYILWDLFHEYGHLISGEKTNKLHTIDYNREVIAWDNAYKKFLKYENLQKHKDSFNNYKDTCLKPYLMSNNKPNTQ